MRNCYTKCIQTSDLIVFVRKQRCFCFVARTFFHFSLSQSHHHRTIILLRKIRYFSVRIHSHATMATPAVSNICANFEEVGQVREQARAFQIQFFPLSPSVCFSFSHNFDSPKHAFLFSPLFSPFTGFRTALLPTIRQRPLATRSSLQRNPLHAELRTLHLQTRTV